MTSFSRLKSSRDQKDTSRSWTQGRPEATQLDSERDGASVDFLDAPKPSLEQPQQSQSGNKQSYPSLGSDLRVELSETKGRGVWSCNPRRKGQTLVAHSGMIACLSTRNLPTHCSACFLESVSKPLKRCPACKVVYYCDSECQSRDWGSHKRECPALQKWSTSAPRDLSARTDDEGLGTIVPSDAIRALGRILWRRQKGGQESIWVKEMDALKSHRSSLTANEHTTQLHTHMAHALVRYLGAESLNDLSPYGIESIGALVDLVSRFTTNAFAVTSPSLTPIGVSISPTIALFNHSCEPNAVLVFPRAQHRLKKEEPLVEIIAIRDIAADEEILISYIDPTLPREQRQQALKETYHFTCDCPLCSKPRGGTDVDPREGVYCPKKCGGTCWLPTEENPLTRCTKCGAVVKDTDAVLDAVRIGQEALDKATRVQFQDPSKAIQLTKNLIPILTSADLLPSSHPLLSLSRLYTSLLIVNYRSPFDSDTIELNSPQIQQQHRVSPESKTTLDEAQEYLDESIRSATRSCNALNQVLPFGHPIRAVAITELGKLLTVDEPRPTHLSDEHSSRPSISPTSPPSTFLPPSPSRQLTTTVPYPPSGPQRLKLAYETLLCARSELMVGFGAGKNEGGQVGVEVRGLLVDVEKELGVWKGGIRSAIADLPKRTSKV